MLRSEVVNAELPSAGYRKVSEQRRLALDLIRTEFAEIDEYVFRKSLWIREDGKALGVAFQHGQGKHA